MDDSSRAVVCHGGKGECVCREQAQPHATVPSPRAPAHLPRCRVEAPGWTAWWLPAATTPQLPAERDAVGGSDHAAAPTRCIAQARVRDRARVQTHRRCRALIRHSGLVAAGEGEAVPRHGNERGGTCHDSAHRKPAGATGEEKNAKSTARWTDEIPVASSADHRTCNAESQRSGLARGRIARLRTRSRHACASRVRTPHFRIIRSAVLEGLFVGLA